MPLLGFILSLTDVKLENRFVIYIYNLTDYLDNFVNGKFLFHAGVTRKAVLSSNNCYATSVKGKMRLC